MKDQKLKCNITLKGEIVDVVNNGLKQFLTDGIVIDHRKTRNGAFIELAGIPETGSIINIEAYNDTDSSCFKQREVQVRYKEGEKIYLEKSFFEETTHIDITYTAAIWIA